MCRLGRYISGYLNIKGSCGRKLSYLGSSSGLSAGGCIRPTSNLNQKQGKIVDVISVMARVINLSRLKD